MSWKWLFFYKWIVNNTIGFVGIAAILFTRITTAGVEFQLYEAIMSNEVLMYFSFLIFGLYLMFFLLGTIRAYDISKTLNDMEDLGKGSRGWHRRLIDKTYEQKSLLLFGKLVILRFMPSVLVGLGMLGTVCGFILMVYGISPEMTTEALIPVILQLTSGLGLAFVTTGIGLTLSIWASYLVALLEKETGEILRKAK